MSREERTRWAREASREARQRTILLVEDLGDEQLLGTPTAVTNPFLWEIGHVAWFQEKWALRHCHDEAPLYDDVDRLYDSSAIPHDSRWSLLLHDRAEVVRYLETVRDRVLERLEQTPAEEELYFVLLSLFHEDMHAEAFTYMRQTLGMPAPRFGKRGGESTSGSPTVSSRADGDVEIPGGTLLLGAPHDEPFVFDNEMWQHPVRVDPFAMARAPVTELEYRDFVLDGGYSRPDLWDDRGWKWREREGAEHPLSWRREGESFLRRDFDQWVPLSAEHPVIHVCWHEARAYCRWKERRLPTEAEWEMAASVDPRGDASARKLRFPWGDSAPSPGNSHLDWASMGTASVHALPGGDAPCGARQMIGNVWEWTECAFTPYPGFIPGPYRDYSLPWFHTHKVLRGGSWATRSRLLRNTWRNYFLPWRRDIFAGFRTCAL
jgi:iron(II)-dependent oxidoreductase